MKPIHYGILTAGLTILAGSALRNHARELKRKGAISKAKPEALQEWEGEGGALRGQPQTSHTPESDNRSSVAKVVI